MLRGKLAVKCLKSIWGKLENPWKTQNKTWKVERTLVLREEGSLL